ncbi:MAG TPA: S-formylglutathione hydrolase, partial [Brevundimonas sp.]|nr:S-formylglutathione hydrolase [Brevundimonas sp.]
MTLQTTKTHAVHGGTLRYLKHDSAATGTPMTLSVFVPGGEGPFPVLIWLSGLTCTEDNFTTKAGAYRAAAEHGLIIVAPDTSPRGDGVADDPAYDLGQGAGFYVDATQEPWAPHFRMESYVTDELIALIDAEFPTTGVRSISGHSMGGHGALTLALRHPDLFRSVSAFAPICSPTRCPWGEKAFSAYLGEDRAEWDRHDA